MSQEITSLLDPLSSDAPCGASLEDTLLLSGFDAWRLFGSDLRLSAETNWREVRDKSLEALRQSYDLRILAHLGAAVVRTEGLDSFCLVLRVAEGWLRDHWTAVYPDVQEDTILRKNALSSFADRMAVVDAVRRAPIVIHRQLGSYSLRHLELATGQLAPGETDTDVPNTAQIEAALEGTPIEELQARAKTVADGTRALREITTIMQTQGGFESAPDLAALAAPLSRIEKWLQDHLARRGASVESASEAGGVEGSESAESANVSDGTVTVGNIRSRQDAIRAIDAAANFFRKNEPSSPVPLLLDRAKRLVSKSFLEVLEDIAPDSLTQARAVGGIKPDQG